MTLTLKASIAGALALTLAAGAAYAQPAAGGGGHRGAAFRQACGADLQKLCPNVQPGPGGGMRECIQTNYKSLSDSCRAMVDRMRQRMQERQQQGGAPAPQ